MNKKEIIDQRDGHLELCVLSALLNADSCTMIDELVEGGLTGADFFTPAYGAIFDMLADRWKKRRPLDSTSVAQALCDSGLLVEIGGVAGLVRLKKYLVQETTRKALLLKCLAAKEREERKEEEQ